MLDSIGIGLLVASQLGQWSIVLLTLYQVRAMAELVSEALDREGDEYYAVLRADSLTSGDHPR